MDAAVILGSAPGAMEELAKAPPEVDILAVNRAGVLYAGRLAGWGSTHPDELRAWAAERLRLGGGMDFPIFTDHDTGGLDYYGPCLWPGSSGLYVLQWALMEAKYAQVALAGVHLSGDSRLTTTGTTELAPNNYETYQDGWRRAARHFDGRVRSYGGWTRDLLGEPDQDFWR